MPGSPPALRGSLASAFPHLIPTFRLRYLDRPAHVHDVVGGIAPGVDNPSVVHALDQATVILRRDAVSGMSIELEGGLFNGTEEIAAWAGGRAGR